MRVNGWRGEIHSISYITAMSLILDQDNNNEEALQIQLGLEFGAGWHIRPQTNPGASRNGWDVALQAGLKRTYDCGLNVFWWRGGSEWICHRDFHWALWSTPARVVILVFRGDIYKTECYPINMHWGRRVVSLEQLQVFLPYIPRIHWKQVAVGVKSIHLTSDIIPVTTLAYAWLATFVAANK